MPIKSLEKKQLNECDQTILMKLSFFYEEKLKLHS